MPNRERSRGFAQALDNSGDARRAALARGCILLPDRISR